MKSLYEEIIVRFPESYDFVNEIDADLPYVLLGCLADWLKSIGKDGFSPDLIHRAVEFKNWILEQPRGKSSDDDLYTMYCVSFYEHLFESDVTLPLIRSLSTVGDLKANADYLKNWVGQDNYEKALAMFGGQKPAILRKTPKGKTKAPTKDKPNRRKRKQR